MPVTAWLEIPDFALRLCRRLFILELFVLWYSDNITYQRKARYAYCDSPFNGFLRCKRLFLSAFP